MIQVQSPSNGSLSGSEEQSIEYTDALEGRTTLYPQPCYVEKNKANEQGRGLGGEEWWRLEEESTGNRHVEVRESLTMGIAGPRRSRFEIRSAKKGKTKLERSALSHICHRQPYVTPQDDGCRVSPLEARFICIHESFEIGLQRVCTLKNFPTVKKKP